MSLPPLSSYSKDQIDELQKFSSVWSHYTEILKRAAGDLSAELRKKRHEAWLQCVAAEYFRTATSKEICSFWSETALQLIHETYESLKPDFPDLAIAVFAFGKLGAMELNLSSDIDIMLVAENENSQQAAFLRRFQTLLSEVTEFGFAFRCDFDLRPGGRMGPLIPTIEQLKDYYGNYSEAWERLAFIRLSALCGSSSVIEEVEKFSTKFIYRRHLDYTLLSDLKDLRQRIHSANWHRSQDRQIDLKLGIGAIRDLELFTHTLLVIHGGKDLQLRVKQTDEALKLLCAKGILPQADTDFMVRHYWHMRRLENLVQAQADQQTHLLKTDFSLPVDRALLRQDMQHCYQLVNTLLGELEDSRSLPETEEEQLAWLKSLGFHEQIKTVWKDLISTSVLSRQKERDELYRKRFLYLFLEQLAHYQRKETALIHLRDFLKATRAKATFYSLLLTHEKLIAQLVRIFVTSPYLSQVLCQRPELIDSFVLRTQDALEDQDAGEILTHLLEKKYLSELIAGSDFLVDQDLSQLRSRASNTADEVASTLLSSLSKEYGEHHVDLLCLGKWGGQELGLRSDLDFICVAVDLTDPTELDLKIARRFVNRLTESHQRGGSLYSVDLRLRPQGQSGVLVTSVEHLLEYLKNEAQAWERQAYLRSRFLNHPQLSAEIHKACIARKITADELKELGRIRRELAKVSSALDPDKINLKYAEGGLVDLELAVQSLVLQEQSQIRGPSFQEHVESLSTCTVQEGRQFIDSWRLMRQAEQLYQALSTETVSVLDSQSQAFVLTAEILKLSPLAFTERLRLALQDNITLLKRLDPRRALS